MIKLVSTVGFIITNDKNEILLIKKVKKNEEEKTVDDNNVMLPKKENQEDEEIWTVPFDTIDEDDNPRDVIKINLKKNLNCDVVNCDYFNLYFYDISDSFIKKVCYFYGTVSGKIKTSNPLEVVEWVNLEKEELDKLNLITEQREALNDFINFSQDRFLEKIE